MSKALNNIDNSFRWVVLIGLASQLITYLVVPFFLKVGGEETYALWTVMLSAMVWIHLSEMGIGWSLTKALIRYRNENENPKSLAIACALTTFSLSILTVTTLLFVKSHLLSYLNFENNIRINISYDILLIVILVVPTCKIYGKMLEANQQFSKIKLAELIGLIISLFVTYYTLSIGFGIIAFAIGYCLKQIITALIEDVFSIKYWREISATNNQFNKDEVMSVIREGFNFQLFRLSDVILRNTDVLLVGIYMTHSDVNIFNFSSKTGLLFLSFYISSLGAVLFPFFTEKMNDKTKSKILSRYVRSSVRLSVLGFFGYVLFNRYVVTAWVGEEYFWGYTLNLLASLLFGLEIFIRLTSTILYSGNSVLKLSRYSLLEAAINLSISLLLVNYCGIHGLIIASITARIVNLSLGIIPSLIRDYDVELSQGNNVLDKSMLTTVIIGFIALLSDFYYDRAFALFGFLPMFYVNRDILKPLIMGKIKEII